jgi:simple sugar transport system ATP-binding protein
MEGIKKSFGGVHALRGVDLEVRKGEIHCLAGENGCGKSTLIKVISGAHDADEGKMWIDGKEIGKLKPIDAIHMGIQVIYQDFAVFPNMTVAENIAMNHELMTGAKIMDWKQAHALAKEAMDEVGADIDPDILLERLSIANKQLVAICRAIINDAKLLILDEPTTALTSKEVDKLWEILRNLKQKGIAIMIVNHKLDEIYQIADTLTIMRNGKYISHGSIDEYDRARFIHDMTGRDFVETKYNPAPSSEVIFEVEHISRKHAFHDVSFTMKKGDVLGITGLLGSGRGEIGDALFGIAPVEEGKIRLNGKEIQIRSIGDAMDNGIAYVPEDRLTQGLFLERSILDNTMAASIKRYFLKGKLNYARMEEATDEWIKKIGVVTPSSKPPIKTLSGGNQQKVVIAKWLNTEPKLLILNGPTVGVDIGAKFDIHAMLHELAEKGVGIIIISDDLSELVQNCNQMIVMQHGVVTGHLSNSISEDELSSALSVAGKPEKEAAAK